MTSGGSRQIESYLHGHLASWISVRPYSTESVNCSKEPEVLNNLSKTWQQTMQTIVVSYISPKFCWYLSSRTRTLRLTHKRLKLSQTLQEGWVRAASFMCTMFNQITIGLDDHPTGYHGKLSWINGHETVCNTSYTYMGNPSPPPHRETARVDRAMRGLLRSPSMKVALK